MRLEWCDGRCGDVAGCDVQVGGQRALGARAALLKLPQEVRPRIGQALAGEAVGHVPAEQHRQFKDPVESCLPSLSVHMITLIHNQVFSATFT